MYSNNDLNPAIEIKDLSWGVGDIEILKNISLEIEKNRFIGIIGPNGSGKTTLLRNISSWFKPNINTVLVDGEDVLSFNSRELSRKMAFVTQSTSIEFEFTAMDVVLMGRSPYIPRFGNEGTEDIEIVHRVMKLTQTGHLKDRNVTNLSGGELQRVMIARALVQDTNVLLLDEPISNLDINHQIQIMDLVKEYQYEKNLTVVTVLHDLNIAAQYCDKLILLDEGKIFCSDEPEKVLTRDNIKRVYGADVHIMENPLNGSPFVIPITSMSWV
ncbi:MAG TPA: ABC transporter ATP-binding protein [Clostridia bacterium]|nr:ABC transporter ATP-binding protein [Clostridia bacterium]